MKTILLVCVLSCQVAVVSGQARIADLSQRQQSDTTGFWYRWTVKEERRVGLNPLQESPYPFHFRITNGGLILDVWQTDTSFGGRLTRWVKEADESESLGRIYSQKYELGVDQATAIGQLVKSSGILLLPSDENIKGWQQGCDGEEIVIQYSDGNKYYLKQYWTPSAQHDLSEAILVKQVYDKVFALANAATVQKAFEAGIPFLCYTTNDAIMTCRVVSTAKYWQYRREISRYKRQLNHKK